MGDLNRLGDGQPLDQDFINEIVDSVNKLSDIVWADQGALVWKGQTDSFNDIAKFRIVGGEGVAKTTSKTSGTIVTVSYGVKFTQAPVILTTPRYNKALSTHVVDRTSSSCRIWIQRVDGKGPLPAGAQIGFSWIAFGPTA